MRYITVVYLCVMAAMLYCDAQVDVHNNDFL